MKKQLFYYLTIVFIASCINLQGQDCVKCDTNSSNEGSFSAALGRNTTASDLYSLAGGENSIAEGDRSFAFGRDVLSSGPLSFAIGTETVASGNSSFASGSGTKANGSFSFASGHSSEATEMYTTAIGFFSKATSSAAVSIGSTVISSGHRSVVIGSGGPWNENIYLENPIPRSLMIGFSSTNPTLFINEAPSSGWFDKTGKVAIGNMTNPQAKLHIYSDDDEAASIFLEPSNWNPDYNAILSMGDANHSISAEMDKGLVFNTGNDFVFNGGFLGLETNEPSALLDVNGTARIRGLSGEGERMVVADSNGNLFASAFSGQCVSCNETTVTGEYASAIGLGTHAIGNNSFSGGSFSETGADAGSSFAFGYEAKAVKNVCIAMGYGAEATGDKSIAFGLYSKSEGASAKTIGNNVIGFAPMAITMGTGYSQEKPLINHMENTFMIGFKSNVPTLFVSSSPGPMPGTTGQVAIGNMTNPQSKLHIYSDDNESATLFLQPSNWNADFNAEIWLGNQQHGIRAELEEGMVYKTEKNHVFKGGDVYIEDIEQGIIMKSPDGKCWRGTLDNSGLLNFAQMESCPGSPDGIFEGGSSNKNDGLIVYPNPTNDFLNIELENPTHKVFILRLVDEKGVEVLAKQTMAETTQIYTGDLVSGIYFVLVKVDGKQMVEKVIRQ